MSSYRGPFYRDRRPTTLGRMINRSWSFLVSMGLTPSRWPGKPPWGTLTLEIKGRRSGRPRSTIVTWVEHDAHRCFVSMLGEGSDWVRNVRAASGDAVIHRRGRQKVRLEEVPPDQRAPILQAYLKKTAISTRRHLGLDPKAPIEEFELIAAQYPVFRVATENHTTP
ncbi:MAG TPA: nitroreductase family deazaflavin-dependent oxidoreductase [Dehalococcoidia bacterium]|nr:nitroreductase family deazaflavin-dependent oxidoreductase [Dehalococcoidia bacterium]